MLKVIIWPTLEAASLQLVAATGKVVSLIVSQSVGDNYKPIIGLNGLEMAKKIDGEGDPSIEGHQFDFSDFSLYTFNIYMF